MYVILAPRYTSVYTPVCWFAGMPRHLRWGDTHSITIFVMKFEMFKYA